MTTLLGKIRLLRTTSSAVSSVVLEEGRLAYLTDENALISGDGLTAGSGLSRISDLSLDASPSLGGSLDLNDNAIVNGSDGCILLGVGASGTGNNSVSLYGNAKTANDSIVFRGSTDEAGSIALGLDTQVTRQYGIAIGYGAASTEGGATAARKCAIAVGRDSTAAGARSIVLGNDSKSDGARAMAIGNYASSSRLGQLSYANNTWVSTPGEMQHSQFVLSRETTNNTPTHLIAINQRLTIPSGTIFAGTANVVGILNGGSKAAMYLRKFAIKNIDNTTSLVGEVEIIGTDIEDGGADWDVQITADDTNEALQINVSGQTGETIRWVGHVQGVEITYGL